MLHTLHVKGANHDYTECGLGADEWHRWHLMTEPMALSVLQRRFFGVRGQCKRCIAAINGKFVKESRSEWLFCIVARL